MKTMATVLCLGVSAMLAAADWPGWRGPTGGGSQPDWQGALIDAPDQARQVWKSEWVPDSTKGGYSSPVIADGRVYLYYFVGDKKQTVQKTYDKLRKGRDYQTEAQRLALASPAADEVVLCLDAKTGETLWKYVSASTGLNQQGSNKVGGHFTPYVGDGVVAVMGSSGSLICLDAVTGQQRWVTPVSAFQNLRDLRDKCVADGVMAPFSRARGFLPCSAPVITDGLVIISDHKSHLAFDLENGAQRWQVPGSVNWEASPLLWHHEGKNYIIGVGNCIDPRSGKQLWSLGRGATAHGSGSPAVAGDVVVFSGRRGRGDTKGQGAAAWRLALDKPTKLWQREEFEVVSGNCTSPGIHDGVAYLHCAHAGPKHRDDGYVLAIDIQTGKEVARLPGIWYVKLTCSVVGMGDRVMIVQCNNAFRLFGTGTNFKELGKAAKWNHIYANSTTPALVDGYMYFHGRDAVYCFDLRKP